MKRQLQRRPLFMFDFLCALAGAGIYYVLFDFMIETVGVPRWMVRTQLLANLAYGIYGAILFVSRTGRSGVFGFLVVMNFIYAGLCVAAALTLVLNGAYGGALLLVVEALFIATLAKVERAAMQSPEAFHPR